MSKFFIQNRKKFLKEMDENNLLIMFAGQTAVKRGDESFEFVPKSNFYYMTGIDSPSVILTIYKKSDDDLEAVLFLERPDEIRAKWTGDILDEEMAEKRSGISCFKYFDEFESFVTSVIFNNNVSKVYMDLENRYWNAEMTEDVKFANQLKQRFPWMELVNAYYIFSNLRIKKNKEEIRHIQKAINITSEAISLMMRNMRPGMMEYEIEAYFDYTLKRHGVRSKAFEPIIASGKNATVLHYTKNSAKTSDGDLILMDVGSKWGYYSADITRTIPLNGRFTQRQRDLYNIVLAGQEKVISAIKPGLVFAELNEILKDYYFKELKRIGLIETKEEISKYYYHGVSHMLGLETHDIGRFREKKLEKGMVFTVEPGLYIEEEGIGIRIEDDVLVTERGCQILSKDIIKTADDIERFMRG